MARLSEQAKENRRDARYWGTQAKHAIDMVHEWDREAMGWVEIAAGVAAKNGPQDSAVDFAMEKATWNFCRADKFHAEAAHAARRAWAYAVEALDWPAGSPIAQGGK
jgi:hypothetical protein